MARYTATYTTAQTDTVIVSVGSGQGFKITRFSISVDKSCTVPYIDAKLEFDDSSDVYVGGHPGIAPGSAYGESAPYGEDSIMEGADGQDLIFTCDAPTGGEVRLTVNGSFITY